MTKQSTTAIVKQGQSVSIQPPTISESRLDRDGDPAIPTDVQYLSGSALKQGVHVMAGPGAGKSRWLGRVPAWIALLMQKPLVVIDPTGAVIDNLFDKIVRLPWEVQYPLWQRLRYIDAGAEDYVVPTPLYYRLGKKESSFAVANRFPAVLKKQDPDLRSAPILGWNSLYECAIYAGQIAAVLGRQLDFVVDLIDHPSTYKGELREALAEHAELQPAVSYFRELMDPTSAKLREKRTSSFKTKLLPFLADPTMLAIFAGTNKPLNWQQADQEQQAVLIDLRHERDPDRRQFKMIWYLKTFTDYIKYRGMAGRGQEIMLIMDEITDMLDQRTEEGHSILAGDMEELVTRLGRNFGVNVILAHQNLSQLDERMQNVLMQMGTQIIGRLSNPDDAVRVARQFLSYDPYWVKKKERVWMKIDPIPFLSFFGGPEFSMPQVIDHRTIEMTPEEQVLLLVNKLQSLGRFRFVTQTATGEGSLQSALKTISIERLDQNQYPSEEMLAPLRRQLIKRDGMPVEMLLAEIRTSHTRETSQKALKPGQQSAKLDTSSTQPYVTADHLPVTTEPATAVLPSNGTYDEEVFQA